jgi:hypothetical protein
MAGVREAIEAAGARLLFVPPTAGDGELELRREGEEILSHKAGHNA